MHASVRRVLRQAWKMDDAERAETLIRNLARRLEPDWNGVSASILEGIDEMLTVTRLGLPRELRRSLACTNIIENVMGTVRRVCRNVVVVHQTAATTGNDRVWGARRRISLRTVLCQLLTAD